MVPLRKSESVEKLTARRDEFTISVAELRVICGFNHIELMLCNCASIHSHNIFFQLTDILAIKYLVILISHVHAPLRS